MLKNTWLHVRIEYDFQENYEWLDSYAKLKSTYLCLEKPFFPSPEDFHIANTDNGMYTIQLHASDPESGRIGNLAWPPLINIDGKQKTFMFSNKNRDIKEMFAKFGETRVYS